MARRIVVPIAALGLTLVGFPASADKPPEPDLFAMFQAICLDHQGDLAGAKAAALAQGLTLAPPRPGATPDPRSEGLFVPPGKVTWYVGLRRPDLAIPGGEFTACAIQAADPGRKLYKAALAWPGVKGDEGPGHKVSFFYRQTAEGRQLLADDAQIEPIVRAGELRVFSAEYGPGGTNVNLATGAPSKD